MAAQNGNLSRYQANMAARNAIVSGALEHTQVIYSSTVANALGSVVTVPLRNVGLVKRLIVQITGTVTAGTGEALTRTPHGLANVFSRIVYTDYSNQTRVNTTGWHLHGLASVRRRAVYNAAYGLGTTATFPYPADYTSAWGVEYADDALAATENTNFRHFVEVPLAYSDTDLRGSVYAGTVSATSQLQLTINPAFFAGSGADPTLSVYASGLASPLATLTNVKIVVYQVYLDQLPVASNGSLVLPILDLSQAYLLQDTTFSPVVVSQDNAIPYANFREFLSTFCIYTQGTAATNTAYGTDINAWALRSANFTDIWRFDPFLAASRTRDILGNDVPKGTYYFDTRTRPINTMAYGNMELVINPSAALASSVVYVGYEMLANINQVTVAGSLPST